MATLQIDGERVVLSASIPEMAAIAGAVGATLRFQEVMDVRLDFLPELKHVSAVLSGMEDYLPQDPHGSDD